jgi:hypothetical protein
VSENRHREERAQVQHCPEVRREHQRGLELDVGEELVPATRGGEGHQNGRVRVLREARERHR